MDVEVVEYAGLGALLILGGIGGLGFTALLSARWLRGTDPLVAFLAWGPLFVSLAALALADAGRFGRPWLSGAALIWGMLGLAAFVWRMRRAGAPLAGVPHDQGAWRDVASDAPTNNAPRLGVARMVGLFILLVAAGWLATPAHRYLLGGWDPGEYVCTAAHIARTGALEIQDPLLPQLTPAERTVLMHEPTPPRRTFQAGYLVIDEATGRLMPDYYHLYPAWLAVWVRGLGLEGAWIGHTTLALFAFALLVAALASLFRLRTALLAGLALLLGPLQLYLMRFTTAEMAAQFGLFAGFWALDRTLKGAGRGLLFTAGAAFGFAILAHSTSVLPAAGVLLYLGVRALRRRDREAWLAMGWIAACAAAAMAWNAVRADVVTRVLWSLLAGHPERWGLAALLALGLLAAGLARPGPRLAPLLRWGPFALVTGLLGAGLFLRPGLQDSPEALNLVFLGRLAGPAALALFALFFALRPWTAWTPGQRAFVAAGLLTAGVLLVNKMAPPLYLWAGRRWAPMVLPFVTALAAEAACGLFAARPGWRRAGTAAGAAALLAWMIPLARTGAPVRRVAEYAGLPGQVEALAARVREADLVLCGHWEPATPLRYAYGIPAASLSHLWKQKGWRDARTAAGLLARWAGDGKRVYWIGDRFFHPALSLVPAGEAGGRFEALERRADRVPRTAVTERRMFKVYRVEAPGAAAPEEGLRLDVGPSAMGLAGGFNELERERAPRAGESFGYRRTQGMGRLYLPDWPGSWKVRVKGAPHVKDRWPVEFRVGGREIGRGSVAGAWETVSFELPAGLGTNGVVELKIVSPFLARGKHRSGVAVDWVAFGE